jgi:hypothetical protein
MHTAAIASRTKFSVFDMSIFRRSHRQLPARWPHAGRHADGRAFGRTCERGQRGVLQPNPNAVTHCGADRAAPRSQRRKFTLSGNGRVVCCSCVSQLVGVNTRYTGLGRCARAIGVLHSSHARCTPEASQIARWRSSTSGGPAAPTAKIGSRPCSIAFGLTSAGCARLVQSVHKFVARIRTPDPPRQWPVHKPRLRTALYSGNQSN